ncbi:hypothetical protein [Enterococcus caccae]|uniref:Uncharacterized protein n=1 Tax=Enterococcus caccae ATCC BAA-1240 TaxID=1158612 RepID=R3WCZ0_9ENTE|nr:hypothetical protein [Enterococcus caccae]EOL45766.1 hypothetical protein UC7_01563 [Enterococcus caccae ATCC BAA-1240]EOT60962.1 hypothetical protein I580_01864 [Enterococcus caccae ATCC BAA-1240]
MKEISNTSIDFEWQSIQIAKELTIAKLNSASATTTNADVGKHIGEMYLSIHEAVQKSFIKADTKS